MKSILTLALIGVVLFSCNKERRPDKPKNLISEAQFSDILFDMFVINSAKGVNKKALEENGIFPEDYIFNKYNIDSVQFANSNRYYAFDQEKYQKILERVQNKVQSEKKIFEAALEKEEEEQTRKLDSIKALNIRIRDSLQDKKKMIKREFSEIRLDSSAT